MGPAVAGEPQRRAGAGVAGLADGPRWPGDGLLSGTPPRCRRQHHPLHGGPDQSGRVHAFCSWIRMGEDGIALDLIRRRPNAAAGAVDLCIVTAIERARSDGLERLSARLGSLPREPGRRPGRAAGPGRSGPTSTSAVCRGYSYRGLSHFKAKFATRWESRDVAVPRGPSGLLALAALIRLHSGTAPAPAAPGPLPDPVAASGWTTAPLPSRGAALSRPAPRCAPSPPG